MLKNNTVIDWCNYTEDDLDWRFFIGTQSTEDGAVTFLNEAQINCDVLTDGDPAVVVKNRGADVNGCINAASILFEFMPVIVPPALLYVPNQGPITESTVITGFAAKFDSINLGNDDELVVDVTAGPVSIYVIGDVLFRNNARLKIIAQNVYSYENRKLLNLYVGGSFAANDSAEIYSVTPAGDIIVDSELLRIYGLDACTSIDLKISEFYGKIYAPMADVTLHQGADFYGAIFAKSYLQKESARFFFDVRLPRPHPYPPGTDSKVEP